CVADLRRMQEDAPSIIVMPGRLPDALLHIEEIVDQLNDDEQLLRVDPAAEERSEAAALVRIVDGHIEGLPTHRQLPDLTDAIHAFVKATQPQASVETQRQSRRRNHDHRPWHPLHFESAD